MNAHTTAIDLAAYLKRIAYQGPLEPTLETLKALHLHHPLAIAFENLDPLLKQPVALDPTTLQSKLVHGSRGGYCFEQNLLFMHVLHALGFHVSGLAARVLWGRPEDAISPRTHMLLRVELPEGTHIADVGFGGLTLTAPLRLQSGLEQATPHEAFRLDLQNGAWRMRAKVGEDWRGVYSFGMEEQFQVDYEIANYFISTNPESHFVSTLMAARPTREGRYALRNNRLTFHDLSGESSPRDLASADEIAAVVRDVFGIVVPDAQGLADAIERAGLLAA